LKVFGEEARGVIEKVILVQKILLVFDFLIFLEKLRFFFFDKRDDFLFVVFGEAGKEIDDRVVVAGYYVDSFRGRFMVF